jgi:valyl-tRNA synthetase
MNVPPSKKASLLIVTADSDAFNDAAKPFFEKLAYSSEVNIAAQGELANSVQIVSEGCTLYIPLSDVVDTEKETARLTKEKERLLGEIDRIDRKLANPGFVAKAPAAVIDGEKEKLAKYKEMLEATEAALAQL